MNRKTRKTRMNRKTRKTRKNKKTRKTRKTRNKGKMDAAPEPAPEPAPATPRDRGPIPKPKAAQQEKKDHQRELRKLIQKLEDDPRSESLFELTDNDKQTIVNAFSKVSSFTDHSKRLGKDFNKAELETDLKSIGELIPSQKYKLKDILIHLSEGGDITPKIISDIKELNQ